MAEEKLTQEKLDKMMMHELGSSDNDKGVLRGAIDKLLGKSKAGADGAKEKSEA